MKTPAGFFLATILVAGSLPAQEAGLLKQQPNTWVKRSPLKGGPPSPGMGYEASFGYDPKHKVVIRWAGHNQGGGGEQNAETWTYHPATAKWTLKEPNLSPPGVCCAQQNVFAEDQNRFLRFRAFSGSHGWQWFREIYLNNSPVWSYDLATNTWRDLRSVPAPQVSPLRCAAWDSDHQVVVIFAGEGNHEGTVVYDPYTNVWTRMRPKVQPAPRSAGNLAYDAERKLHILFGAQFADDPHTWAYNLRKNEWRDMKPKVQPPTDKNDAVLAYDAKNKIVVASVRVIDKTDGKEIQGGHYETWTYDAGKNEWQKMNPPSEPPGWGNRRRILAYVPDQNVVLMENYINPSQRVPGVEREQQIWTYRYAEPKEKPGLLPPPALSVTTTKDGAGLFWKPSPSPGVTGYKVFRGEGSLPWKVAFAQIAQVDSMPFIDPGVKPGKVYHYFVQAIGKGGESSPSRKVRTQLPTIEDVVVSVVSPAEARITWPAPAAKDIAGYHVERAVVDVLSEDQILRLKKDTPPLAEPSVGGIRAIGPFVRLTKTPVKETRFSDTTIDLRKPATFDGDPLFVHRFPADRLDPKGKPYRYAVYAYRVIAVNKLGVDSGAGPYALTIPSPVKWLFSKEAGEKCHLIWAANPEQKIAGYRVYRMESPRINGPGQPVTRLTAEPVALNRYIDDKAGKVTRRYWVVAVDALGQEGCPSAPAWFERQFKKYYAPFVGEWHQ